MLPASAVASVCPGDPGNPANVRVLEAVFSEAEFAAVFPRADPAYTYTNLLRAVAAFPRVCRAEAECRATLAAVFAHFQQETAGLFYLEEINKGEYCASWTPWVVDNFPCTPGWLFQLFFSFFMPFISPGKKYYGRGAKQLSWNYNYGAFSFAVFGDPSVLLRQVRRNIFGSRKYFHLTINICSPSWWPRPGSTWPPPSGSW